MSILNYKQQGQGPNILLIHGLFGSLENLNMVANSLKENHCVTNIDVRNHGSSFHENNMEYKSLAEDVVHLMTHLGINDSHLLGHSMGGKLAMEIALSYPDKVNKLIVADIAPVEYPAHHQHIINGLKSIDLSQVSSRKDADKQLSSYVNEVGIRQFLLRNLAQQKSTESDVKFSFKCNLEFIDNCYHQIMQGYQGDSVFSEPTLFIKGGNSDYITASHRNKIIKHFPNSKAKIVQGAGHWLHAEKTVAFNKIVSDFLAE